jgi:hypothetical protein
MIDAGAAAPSATTPSARSQADCTFGDAGLNNDTDAARLKARQFATCSYAYRQFYFYARKRHF